MKQRSNRQVSWVFVFLVVLAVPAAAMGESGDTVFVEDVDSSVLESGGEGNPGVCEAEEMTMELKAFSGEAEPSGALSSEATFATAVPSRFKVHLYRAKGYDPYLYLGNYPYKGLV